MTAKKEDDVCDLTDSFTLVDHTHLNNVVIDLDTDESFLGEINVTSNPVPQQVRRKLTPRKRQSTKPLTKPRTGGAVCIEINKKAKKNLKEHQPLPEEPKVKKTKKEASQGCCSICLDEFGTKPLSSTKCGHVFCTDCLKRAMKKVAQCPQCRTKLRGASAVHPLFL